MTNEIQTDPEAPTLEHWVAQLSASQRTAVEGVLCFLVERGQPSPVRWTGCVIETFSDIIEAKLSEDSSIIGACEQMAALCLHKISTLPRP